MAVVMQVDDEYEFCRQDGRGYDSDMAVRTAEIDRSASRQRTLSINSALAFASAELVTAALHEAGHGLAAQAFGFSPHIYAFYENNPSGNARETLTILAAGPNHELAARQRSSGPGIVGQNLTIVTDDYFCSGSR